MANKIKFSRETNIWNKNDTANVLLSGENNFIYVGFVSSKTKKYMEMWIPPEEYLPTCDSDQVDYSGVDPRWNPAVAKIMHEQVKADMQKNPIDTSYGIFKFISSTSWSSLGSQKSAFVPKKFAWIFSGEVVVAYIGTDLNHGVSPKSLYEYVFSDKILMDYDHIDVFKKPADEYTAELIFNLYKSKLSGKYMIVSSSPNPKVLADKLAFIANDKGASNWSGHWRRPDL